MSILMELVFDQYITVFCSKCNPFVFWVARIFFRKINLFVFWYAISASFVMLTVTCSFDKFVTHVILVIIDEMRQHYFATLTTIQ